MAALSDMQVAALAVTAAFTLFGLGYEGVRFFIGWDA